MNARVEITSHSMQQIAIANRRAENEPEAIDRKQEQYKAFALADITKNVLKDDKTAEAVADEILGKFGTDEMVAVIRACFANDRELAIKLILAHADQAMDTLAELEAYRAFN